MRYVELRQPHEYDLVGREFTLVGNGAGRLLWRVLSIDGEPLADGQIPSPYGPEVFTEFAHHIVIPASSVDGMRGVPVQLHVVPVHLELNLADAGQTVPLTLFGELEGWRLHKVEPRETLWKLVRRHGGGLLARDIAMANRDQVRDPDRIRPGQVLRIPVLSTEEAVGSVSVTVSAPTAADIREETDISIDVANTGTGGVAEVALQVHVAGGASIAGAAPTAVSINESHAAMTLGTIAESGSVRQGLRLRLPGQKSLVQLTVTVSSDNAEPVAVAHAIRVGFAAPDPTLLSQALASARTPSERLDAVVEALTAAGMAPRDMAVEPPVESEPVVYAHTFPGDALAVAQAHPQFLTVAQLARMLAQAGWPFKASQSVEQQFAATLRSWINHADDNRQDPTSLGLLLAAENVRRREPAADFMLPDVDPERVALTALDLLLVTTAWQRAVPSGERASSPSASLMFPNIPLPPDCKRLFENWFGKSGAADEATKFVIGKKIEHLFGERKEDVAKALLAVDLITKAVKLALRYSSLTARLELLSPDALHKPLPGKLAFSRLRLVAGVSEEDWKAYQQRWQGLAGPGEQAIRNCLALVNINLMPDLADLADAADKWKVMWRIVQGSPEHAFINEHGQEHDWLHVGQLEMRANRHGSHEAQATILVDLQSEDPVHHQAGPVRRVPITVRAEVRTHEMPGLSTWIAPVLDPVNGTVTASADIISGWIEALVPTSITKSFTAEYHGPLSSYHLVGSVALRVKSTWRRSSDYVVEGTDSELLKLQLHLQWDSGWVVDARSTWSYIHESHGTTDQGLQKSVAHGVGQGTLSGTGARNRLDLNHLTSPKQAWSDVPGGELDISVEGLAPVTESWRVDTRLPDGRLHKEEGTKTKAVSMYRVPVRWDGDQTTGQRVLNFDSTRTEVIRNPSKPTYVTTVTFTNEGQLQLHASPGG